MEFEKLRKIIEDARNIRLGRLVVEFGIIKKPAPTSRYMTEFRKQCELVNRRHERLIEEIDDMKQYYIHAGTAGVPYDSNKERQNSERFHELWYLFTRGDYA
jgi:hypothetical protein